MREIQYKIRVNKAHMKNDGNEISLKTESTENTADNRIYTAIFRIWIPVFAVKGELSLPIHPNTLLALYRAKKIQINKPRQQTKKNTHCPKLSVWPFLIAVPHASCTISGIKSWVQTITMIPANNDTLIIPKIMQPMLRSMEIKWAVFFKFFLFHKMKLLSFLNTQYITPHMIVN